MYVRAGISWMAGLFGLALVSLGVFQGSKLQAADPKMDHKALAGHIDKLVDSLIKAEGVKPSPRASDAEFLRRVYLDLTGRIPTAEQAAAFLASNDSDKRAKLIDELLASPNYGNHLRDIWLKKMLPRTSDNRRVQALYPLMGQWLAEGFNNNRPWNEMAADLLTATGSPQKNGAVVFYLANTTPDKITDNISKLFLGVQLQCAQCHDHPFTSYQQDEYWGMAAFFFKVRFSGNPRQVGKKGSTVNLTEGGRGRKLRLPREAKRVPPKFLQGEQPKLDSDEPYRPALAKWVTSKDNPFFARAVVNKTWAMLFGSGIVNPVEDMHEGNSPSHPQLLKDLSTQFQARGYDLKYLFRAICNSEAYQRSSKPTAENKQAPPSLFARMAIKVMTSEQLFDSLNEAIGPAPQDARRRARNKQGRGNTPRDVFVAFFDVEENVNPTEYQAGIPQALYLMNAQQFNATLLRNPVVRSDKEPAEVIDQLYLRTVSRYPTAAEKTRLTAYISSIKVKAGNQRTAYADILWALINSSEFTLNH